MRLRPADIRKVFRKTKTKALNISTALVLAVSSIGGALPVILTQKASAHPHPSVATELRLSSSAPAAVEAGTGTTSFSVKEVINGFGGWSDVDTGTSPATITATVTSGQISTDCATWGTTATVTIPVSTNIFHLNAVTGTFCYRGVTVGTHNVSLSDNVPYPILSTTLKDSLTVPVTVVDTTTPSVPTGGEPSGSIYKTSNVFDYTWLPSTDNSDGHIVYEYQASDNCTTSGADNSLTHVIWSSNANGSTTQKTALQAGPSIPSQGTSDGFWCWQVRAVDASGNMSAWSQAWGYTMDSQAPNLVVTSPAPNAYERTSFDVTATASDSDGLNAYYVAVDGTGEGYTYHPANGTMPTVTIDTSSLSEGPHTLLVRVTDLAGNAAQVSQTFTVDRTRPTVTFTNPTDFNNTTYNKYFAAGPDLSIQASDATSGITGTVLHVYNSDGSTAKFCPVSATDTTSCDVSSLPAGDYYVKAGATDGAGNNQTITKYFTIDKTKPTVAFTAPTPADNAYVNSDFTVGFTAHDNAALKSVNVSLYDNSDPGHLWQWKATCYQNNTLTAADLSDTCVLHLPAGLTDGAYVLKVGAQDAAGNWSVNAQRTINIDRVAPDAPSADFTADNTGNSVANGGITNSLHFTFNLSDTSSDVARYQLKYWNNISGDTYEGEANAWNPTDVTLGGHSSTLGVYTDLFTRGEGTHYFAFSACDAAGNCSAYSAPFAVTYDATAPTVTVDNQSTADTTPTITGTVDDADAVVKVTVNGHTYTAAVGSTANTSGTYNWSAAVTNDLTAGNYTVSVSATDTANNAGTAAGQLTVTTIPAPAPAITFLSKKPVTQNIGSTNGQVLGDSTTTPSDNDTTNNNGGKVKGDSTVNIKDASNKKSGNFLGLGWWWLAVLAALLLIWLAVANRKANEDK